MQYSTMQHYLVQYNEREVELRTRLTATRDFRAGRRNCLPPYAVNNSAWADWYEDEYKSLEEGDIRHAI